MCCSKAWYSHKLLSSFTVQVEIEVLYLNTKVLTGFQNNLAIMYQRPHGIWPWGGGTVNTQTWTHAQIHIHTQIPAYVQLPTLFQPHALLQPSTHLHCDQAPCPAKISTGHPFSAEAPLIIRRPSIISADGNGVATIDHLGLYTLVTRSQPYRKGCSPSSVPLTHTLIPHPSLFQHPWPLPSPFTWP